jgi:hypothetical protein
MKSNILDGVDSASATGWKAIDVNKATFFNSTEPLLCSQDLGIYDIEATLRRNLFLLFALFA